MRIEFRRFGSTKVKSLPWRAKNLTFDDLSYQAKAALSGFYISNQHAIWPRRPDAPEEVRFVDDHGQEIVVYTVADLIEETQRILVPAEPLEAAPLELLRCPATL